MIDAAIIAIEATVKSEAVKTKEQDDQRSEDPEALAEFIELLGELLGEEYCRALTKDNRDLEQSKPLKDTPK